MKALLLDYASSGRHVKRSDASSEVLLPVLVQYMCRIDEKLDTCMIPVRVMRLMVAR